MANIIRCPDKNALEIERDGKQFGTYIATVPPSHTLDDVMTPDYFGMLQSRATSDRLLRPGDFIDVRPLDFSWYVRLMVRALDPVLNKVVTFPIVPPVHFSVGDLPDGWDVEYMGLERKWTVFYQGAEKASHLKTPEEAALKIRDLGGEASPVATPATRKRTAKPQSRTKATEAA